MNSNYILGEEKIINALMKLSIPATVAMLVNAVYNIIDTIFVGRGVGTLGIAGVSIYLPFQMIIMSIALLFGIGISSIVSRKMGQNDTEGAYKAFGNLILLVSIFSIFTSILGFIFAENVVKFLGASTEVLPYATDFARTMFPGVLVFPLCVAANNIIRAEGNAKDAMYSMLIGVLANIILDYIFIYKLGFGVAGAGLATSISQGINFLYLIYYFKKKSSIKIKIKYLKFDFNIFKETISIGSSAFITQVSMSIVALLLNYTLFKYGGDLAISIYGIVYKLTLFIQMPLIGLVQGMQPIVGFNMGAQNEIRAKKALKLTLVTSTLIGTMLTLVIILDPTFFINLFTTNTSLITEGSKVLKFNILMYPIIGIYLTAVGFYQSIGKGRASLVLSLLRQLIFFIPLSLILPSIFNLGLWGIWLAFPISDLLSFICTVILAKISINKNPTRAKLTA